MDKFKWGYAWNQWNTVNNTLRREEIARALKVISVCGFEGVEIKAGTGRWEPLGRPELIDINFGSQSEFLRFVQSCGVSKVVSWFYDPGQPFLEEGAYGRDPANPGDHKGILESTESYIKWLGQAGADFFNVRPMLSFWKTSPVTDAKLQAAADCWNEVGAMASRYGVQLLVHFDWLSSLREENALSKFLQWTDRKLVGLTIDTAEVTLAGLDPLALYQEYADRVKLFHFKNVKVTDSLQEYKNAYADSLLKNGGQRKIGRWFWEMDLADGLVDFVKLMAAIRSNDFSGWIIAESDQSPDPAESAMLNHWYIVHVLKS